jgi:multisubunit Na+/H+ antiporter MnhG subunit
MLIFVLCDLEGWAWLLLLLLLAIAVTLPIFFVYLLARAVYKGTHPEESLTTLHLGRGAEETHESEIANEST